MVARTCSLVAILSMTCLTGQAQAELTPLEKHGKQIYTQGTSPSGAEINALVGVDGFSLPANTMPCVGCHGPDGRGRPEGGVVPSDVTWSHLTTSYGHQHSYGREHEAFDRNSLAVAIRNRVDPAGNRLDIAMPAYTMGEEDLDALLAYLKKIDVDFDPGVAPESIRIATLIPESGNSAPLGKAIHAVLQAYIDEVNADGGINGRRVSLDVVPFGLTATDALANLRDATSESPPFALLSPYSVGIETELADFAEEASIPIIAPYTLQPPVRSMLDRNTFYLFSGEQQQVRVLVDSIAGQFQGGDPRVAFAGTDNSGTEALSKVVARESERLGWQAPTDFSYATAEFEAGKLASDIQAAGTGVLFFFGTRTELESLLGEFKGDTLPPYIAISANRVPRSILEAGENFNRRIMIAYPRSPTDVSEAGRSLYSTLRENYDLSGDFAAAQLAALTAAKTFGEAAMRSGRNLSRESLISSLESLRDYETGLAPPISFGLNRRIGALGAHVVRLNAEERSLEADGGWKALK